MANRLVVIRLDDWPFAPGNEFGVFVESGGDWPYLVELYDLPWSMNTDQISCQAFRWYPF